MFQNFIQDVLNRVDGTSVVVGEAAVLSRAAAGDICRVTKANSTNYSVVELEIDPNKNSMVTFDLNYRVASANSTASLITFAAIVNNFGKDTYTLANTVQTVLPRTLTSFGSDVIVGFKGAVNVPKIGGAASGKYSCLIGVTGQGYLHGIARVHYSEFHTFQPNK